MGCYDEMESMIAGMRAAHATASDPDAPDREQAIIRLESAVGRCLAQLDAQDGQRNTHMMWVLMGWEQKVQHKFYECPQPCNTMHCQFCEGGLGLCTACDCFEGTLPSECPGGKVSYDDQQLIYAGKRDFRHGAWVDLPSGSASSHYDGRPGLPSE